MTTVILHCSRGLTSTSIQKKHTYKIPWERCLTCLTGIIMWSIGLLGCYFPLCIWIAKSKEPKVQPVKLIQVFPRPLSQSSRVLWGYISLTHWHSWAGESFSSRSSWDDWCKYAAAEHRHWRHHRTDPVRERERGGGGGGQQRDIPSHLWLTFIFVTPHVFKQLHDH